MNKRIDFTNIGGLPVDQDTLAFMQESYRGGLGAVARALGDKVILPGGVVVNSGNVTDGWITYNGELVRFVGGPVAAKVVVQELATAVVFEDGNQHDVEFTKVATCALIGNFDFSELKRMEQLVNFWQPGDLKQKYVNTAYITANFDANGFGINSETGWRILSKAYPNTAGKVFVNLDPADADFNQAGKFGGTKTHTLTKGQLPKTNLLGIEDQATVPAGGYGMMRATTVGENATVQSVDTGGSGYEPNLFGLAPFPNLGNGEAFSKMPPYFVVLTLIKI